jgi:hypothetical protein
VRSSAASRGIQESADLEASRATRMPSPPRILIVGARPSARPAIPPRLDMFCTEWQNPVRDGG